MAGFLCGKSPHTWQDIRISLHCHREDFPSIAQMGELSSSRPLQGPSQASSSIYLSSTLSIPGIHLGSQLPEGSVAGRQQDPMPCQCPGLCPGRVPVLVSSPRGSPGSPQCGVLRTLTTAMTGRGRQLCDEPVGNRHSPFFVSLSLIMNEPIFVSGSCSSSSALSLPSPSNSHLGSRKAAVSILSVPNHSPGPPQIVRPCASQNESEIQAQMIGSF